MGECYSDICEYVGAIATVCIGLTTRRKDIKMSLVSSYFWVRCPFRYLDYYQSQIFKNNEILILLASPFPLKCSLTFQPCILIRYSPYIPVLIPPKAGGWEKLIANRFRDFRWFGYQLLHLVISLQLLNLLLKEREHWCNFTDEFDVG